MAYRLYTVLALLILIGRSSAAEASGADNDTCLDTLIAMGAAIGALALLEVVTVIGWLCTVVMQWNRLKPTNRR